MGKFLDAQQSTNANFAGSISIPTSTTPALFGTLGLMTSGAGANLRVNFTATVTLAATVTAFTPITITIIRGFDINTGVPVYTATEAVPVGGLLVASEIVFTITGTDYRPPNPGSSLVYQAYITLGAGVAVAPTRVGPESFFAAAYSD
jgi:hypothetical protein